MKYFYFISIVSSLFFLSSADSVIAQDSSQQYLLKVLDYEKLTTERIFKVADIGDKARQINFSLVDLGGDGQQEIVLTNGTGGQPWLKIFDGYGNLINEYLVYNENFFGGVSLTTADFDNDKKSELVVGAGEGGGPHVRILDGFGKMKINPGFFSGDKKDLSGIRVTAGDVDNDNKPEIIVWQRSAPSKIRIFNLLGQLNQELSLDGLTVIKQIQIFDFDSDKKNEIFISGFKLGRPVIQAYQYSGRNIWELSFDQFKSKEINFSFYNNGQDKEIIVSGGLLSEPLLLFVNLSSKKVVRELKPFEKDYQGGLQTIVGDIDGDRKLELVVAQERIKTAEKKIEKYIAVDISEQKLRYYQNGYLINEQIVSSGKKSMPTPIGEFKILNKIEVAYSRAYNLYMPHWLGFTWGGAGIHGLPYWKNGKKIVYEGANHLGQRVSHGCVRLSLEAAEELYDWVVVGTPVFVSN